MPVGNGAAAGCAVWALALSRPGDGPHATNNIRVAAITRLVMAHVQLLPLVGQVTKYRGPPVNRGGFLRNPGTDGIPSIRDADIVPSVKMSASR